MEGIQALRAVAALVVVLLHVADEAGALTGTPAVAPWPWVRALPLEAGVDTFFVISGFVMVWSSWAAFGDAGAVWPFVLRRLLRVVPLYWLLTGATAAVALAVPAGLRDGSSWDWGYVAASMGFVPWRRADGFVQPLLRVGWTLNYEMLFYMLFAAVLPLRRAVGIGAALAALAALAAAGLTAPANVALAFWTDPVVLEFGFGILVAVAARTGGPAGWLRLGGFLAACALADGVGGGRALAWGVPAAFLLFWAVTWRGLPRFWLLLGDASYALYLVHAFPMRAVRIVFVQSALSGSAAAAWYVIMTTAACVAAAFGLHIWVERPLGRWAHRNFTADARRQRE